MNTNQYNDVVVAAADAVARKYQGLPWADDRAQDAALVALLALNGGTAAYQQRLINRGLEKAADALLAEYGEVPAFDGNGGLAGAANYCIGMGQALSQKRGSGERELASLESVFSQFVGDDEDFDPTENLGITGFYPGYDLNAGFRDADGNIVSLETVASRLAELAAVQPDLFGADRRAEVEDSALAALFEWAGNVEQPVAFTEVAQEAVREYHTVETVLVSADGAKTRVFVCGALPGYDAPVSSPDVEETPFDVVSEEWRSVTTRDWQAWRNRADRTGSTSYNLAAGRTPSDKEYDGTSSFSTTHEKRDFALRVVGSRVKLLARMRPWQKNDGCQIAVPDENGGFKLAYLDSFATWRYGYAKELHRYTNWGANGNTNEATVALALGSEQWQLRVVGQGYNLLDDIARLLEDEGVSDSEAQEILNLIDDQLELAAGWQDGLPDYAHSIKNLLGGLLKLDVSGFDGGYFDTSNSLAAQLEELVDTNQVFPSAVVRPLLKLQGCSNPAAARLGDAVVGSSRELKAAVGQKRFANATEKLIAERVTGVFGMDLPEKLVAVIGTVSVETVRRMTARLSSFGIVGCSEQAAAIAAELGVRYYGINLAPQVAEITARMWAQGQALAVADFGIAGSDTVQPKSMLKGYADKLNIRIAFC